MALVDEEYEVDVASDIELDDEVEELSDQDDDDLDDDELDELLDELSDQDEEPEEEKKEDGDEEPEELEEEPEEEPEEEEDADEDYGDEGDDSGLAIKDILGNDDTARPVRRQYIRLQRYCKSLSDNNPRNRVSIDISREEAIRVLSTITTEKNACMFGAFINNKTDLYNLCGKLIHKAYPNKDLFLEMKNKVSEWDSKTYEKYRKVEDREIEIATTEMKVVKGLYKCGRCKSEKTFSRQVQTRSADEGMTSIIQCADCSKVWREYA